MTKKQLLKTENGTITIKMPCCNIESDEIGETIEMHESITLGTMEHNGHYEIGEHKEYYCRQCGNTLDEKWADDVLEKAIKLLEKTIKL